MIYHQRRKRRPKYDADLEKRFSSIVEERLSYGTRRATAMIRRSGIRAYFLPKTNATFHAKGVESWKTMLYSFIDDTQEWLAEYHMRSLSESVNSMLKRKMPVKVRKKLPLRKKTEEILKINMHNLRQYSYLKHTYPEMIKDYRELYLK
jgi:hypothetical protein